MPRADFLSRPAVAPALLAIAVLLAWFNALTGPFQFDDYNVIVGNPAVHSLAAWLDAMPGIRPLLKLTYALNWSAGASPFGFHLFNVVVHAANAILAFLLLRELRPGGTPDVVAFAAALLFALHPVQTEAVTYVSGRSVSLMALFYLGSLLAYVRADPARPWRGRVLSAALFAAALMVKETAVTLPLALLLVDAMRPQHAWRDALRRQALHWGVLAAAVLILALSPTYRHLADVSLATRPLAANLLTQANAWFWLAGQLAMPWRLNADPDLPVVMAWSVQAGAQVAVILGLLAGAAFLWRRQRWLAFALLWVFLHLAPTNSLLPRLDVANDRQLYLAAIGAFMAIAAGLQWLLSLANRRWIAHAALVVLALALGSATVARNQVYASQSTFWEDAAAKSPGKPRVHNNLGWVYQQEGRRAEARRAYLRALDIDPGYWRARINLEVLDAPGEQAPGDP
jgi:tetratricopeptide (TPR) repeat protein